MNPIDVSKVVTVGRLIEYAGQFNEEIRLHGISHDYVRAQIDLIMDAAGLPMEDSLRAVVYDAIVKASDDFFRAGKAQ